jgi:hypothetical protein
LLSHKSRSPQPTHRIPGRTLRNLRTRSLCNRAHSPCNRGIRRSLGSRVPRSPCSLRGRTLLWQAACRDQVFPRFLCRRCRKSRGSRPRFLPHREQLPMPCFASVYSLPDQRLPLTRRPPPTTIQLLPISLQLSSDSFASKSASHVAWRDLLKDARALL